jgi:tetratricopeptide (TPR) repeat protein
VRRTREHILETASERAFASLLPAEWTDHPIRHDYGIDLKVEIFDLSDGSTESRTTGLEFAVQLKATDLETARRLRVGVGWDHVEYWQSLSYPTLVVRYCAADREMYAMWVHERSRRLEERPRKQAWFRFEERDLLASSRWSAIRSDVEAFRRARTAAVRLPLTIRLDAPAYPPEWSLSVNTFIRRSLGEEKQIVVDQAASTSTRIRSEGPGEFAIDLGGGMAIVIHGSPSWIPAPPDVLFLLGVCLGRCGNYSDAARCIRSSLDSEQTRVPELRAAAFAFCRAANDLDTATELVVQHPWSDVSEATLLWSLLNVASSLSPLARSRLKDFADRTVADASGSPRRGVELFNQANVLRSLNLQIEAMLAFREALAELPAYADRSDYWRFRAGSEFLSGEFEASAKSYLRAIERGDDDPMVVELWYDALLAAGDYLTILESAARSPDLSPDAQLTWLVASAVRARFGINQQKRDPERALKVLQTSAGDAIEQAAVADALLPGVWWNSEGYVSEDGSVDHPENLFVAARLVDDDASLWAQALVLGALVGMPEPMMRAGYRRARLKTDDEVTERVLEAVRFFADVDDPATRARIDSLLALAAETEQSRIRDLVVRDGPSGEIALRVQFEN